MNQATKKYFLILPALALVAGVGFGVSQSFAQESDDAMNDFLSEGAKAEGNGTPGKEKASPAKAKGAKTAPAEGTDPAAPTSDAEFVDMRTDAPAAAPMAQTSPALDKLEALLIADAEMKAFMKAGGLHSRKIKP